MAGRSALPFHDWLMAAEATMRSLMEARPVSWDDAVDIAAGWTTDPINFDDPELMARARDWTDFQQIRDHLINIAKEQQP